MIAEHHDGAPLVLLANFASPVSVSLKASEAVRRWSAQAPRKIWLARPGDVLVTPVPSMMPATGAGRPQRTHG
ncbi:hypothetical protein AB0C61_15365 [Streptomyces sp. NPDC048680]|uniref:hypothetical protein n=1 Tax=Streptomyces sp. NPDC048680 TaxID=3155492 RepID=UPI0034497F58